jgi:small-conductance mechanosensitive channel
MSFLAAPACGTDPSWVCERVLERTDNEALAGAADWFVAKPFAILVIIVVAFIVSRVARWFIKRTMQRILHPPAERARKALRRATPSLLLKTGETNLRTEARVQTLTTVFRSLATVIVWFFAAIAMLEVVQINLAPLLASASVIGVAVGFGAQNIVRDFLAGTFMVVEDQMGVGDIVDIGEAKGTVEQVTLRATRVRDVNGTLWHVPNGQILRVANKSQEWARAVLDIEVDGATDYDEAAAVIQQVAEHVAADPDWMVDIVATPEVWGIESFTADGYTIRLVVKTRPATQFGVMRELRIQLREAFAEHGILLPGERWAHEVGHDLGLVVKDPAKPSVAAAAQDDRPEHPTRGDPAEAG